MKNHLKFLLIAVVVALLAVFVVWTLQRQFDAGFILARKAHK